MHTRPPPVRFLLTTLFTLALSLLLTTLALAQSFQGKVIKVLDGDTIDVLYQGKPERIRFHGIDAPESGQPYGTKAKQFVLDIAAQQIVAVEVRDTDRYGRTVGEVFLPDGKSLNREIVKAGYAWWYRQYSKDETLGDLEAEARAARKGLWADPNPVPPWEWRAASRVKQKNPAKQTTPKDTKSLGPYHGNISSKVFHQSSCSAYNCKNCTDMLAGREEATAQGYRPCGICKP